MEKVFASIWFQESSWEIFHRWSCAHPSVAAPFPQWLDMADHLELAVGQSCTRNCQKTMHRHYFLANIQELLSVPGVGNSSFCSGHGPCCRFYNLHISSSSPRAHHSWLLERNISDSWSKMSRHCGTVVRYSEHFPPFSSKRHLVFIYAHVTYMKYFSSAQGDLYMKVYTSFPAQVIQVAKCHLRNVYRRWETASCQVCYSQHYSLDIKSRFSPGRKSGAVVFFDGQRVEEEIKHSETLRRLKPETQVDSGFFWCLDLHFFDAWNKVKHIYPKWWWCLMVIYHDYHQKKSKKNITLDKSHEGGFEQLHEVQNWYNSGFLPWTSIPISWNLSTSSDFFGDSWVFFARSRMDIHPAKYIYVTLWNIYQKNIHVVLIRYTDLYKTTIRNQKKTTAKTSATQTP